MRELMPLQSISEAALDTVRTGFVAQTIMLSFECAARLVPTRITHFRTNCLVHFTHWKGLAEAWVNSCRLRCSARPNDLEQIVQTNCVSLAALDRSPMTSRAERSPKWIEGCTLRVRAEEGECVAVKFNGIM
jgi:hypothetical protein